MLPMTLDRVGQEVKSPNEEPVRVESVSDAFKKFQPKLDFRGTAGEEETEFRADLRFKSIEDFNPKNLLKRQEGERDEDGNVTYLRNDLADLEATRDLLYRLKDRWKLPAMRRAWQDPARRKEIIRALGELKTELEKVAGREDK